MANPGFLIYYGATVVNIATLQHRNKALSTIIGEDLQALVSSVKATIGSGRCLKTFP